MITTLFTLFYPLIRFIFQFRDVPYGLALLGKPNKTPLEKVQARSFGRYFIYHSILFFLFFIAAIGSLIFVPIDFLSLKISVPVVSAIVYFLLNRLGKKTLGRQWFASRHGVIEAQLEQLKRKLKIMDL